MYGNPLWGYWFNQRVPVNERELRIIAASLAKMTGIKIVRTNNPVWSVNVDTKVMSIPNGDLYDEDIGFLIHESAHLRFSSSDKKFMEKLMEIIKPLKKDPEQIWLLIQVLEDIRVNYKIEQLYRGAKKYIDRTYSIKSDEYISELRKMMYMRNSYEYRMYMSNMRHLQFLKLITLYPRKLASYIRQLENSFTHRSVKSVIGKSLKYVNEIPNINDTLDLFEPFKKILKYYLPFCKDVQDDPQQGQQSQDNQQENQSQGNSQNQGNQEKQDQQSQGGQNQQDQQNQQDKKDQQKDQQIDNVVQQIIEAMNQSQERRESGELSDSPKNDIEPKEDKKDQQDDSQDSSQGGGGMGQDSRDREIKIGYGEEKRKEEQDKSIDLDDLTDFYDKLEKGWVTPYEDFTLEELQKAVGENLASMRKSVSVLKDMSFERHEGNYQSGKLQNRRLYKLQVKKTNIFTKKIVDVATDRDMAIAVLVDESGSMRGQQSVCACIASSVLGRALELAGKPFMVCGFNEYFYVHKNWKERLNLLKMLDVAKNAYENGSGKTNDAYAIHKVSEMMKKVSERNKILIVLSDGSPNPSSRKDEDGVKYNSFDLKEEVLKAEKSGVKIYSIGIMDNAVKDYYSRWKEIKGLDELAPELRKIFIENVGKRVR